jgi:Domain of unknown function (DUF6378)
MTDSYRPRSHQDPLAEAARSIPWGQFTTEPVVMTAEGPAPFSRVKDNLTERARVLDEAKNLICGDRNNQYGEPHQDFQRTAGVLNALGYLAPDGPLKAHDVAVIISAVKLSRIMWSPEKRDHWVDLAGYAACGYECVTKENNE